MIHEGDILYVIPGRISPDLDGCPVIVTEKQGTVFRLRYQKPGLLSHDWGSTLEKDIPRYFEKR